MPPTALTGLFTDGGPLRDAYRATEPVVLPRAVDVGAFPAVSDITALVDGSLLRRPYFTVLQDGVKPPDSDVMTARRVGGASMKGYLDPEGVHRHLDAGATLKLNQVEDWHPYIRDVNDALNACFPVESKAFLFYTPAGKRGMLPHRDGSRVIAIQIEGAKEWHLYGEPGDARADPGLDVDTSHEQVVLMEPGDLLYLPHGYGHAATAVGSTSLHVTFTLTEPFPAALASAYLAGWVAAGGPGTALAGLDGQPSRAKAAALLASLAAWGATADPAELLDQALLTARTRDTSR